MQAKVNHCDPERLRLLVQDLLDPEEMSNLEEHLQDCATCRQTLDRWVKDERWLDAARLDPASELTDALESERVPDEQTLNFLAPSDWPDSLGRLGNYEVKGVLGKGGMGVVLKALDPALNRYVAIKVLGASLASCGAAKRRFLREARAAAAVAHEHVVAVHAVVETAGLPFLVMEYVPGRSLQERIDANGPLALAEILRIGNQTAAGLAAAHAQGLVHRDVKPANILLENGVERVRLTDFGLARAADDAGLTQSGVVTGTPYFMAPEQARGEAVDHRADLFSLGSTLYAMCTGHPPFRAESAVAVLRRVSDDEPTPIQQINPDIPEWLEGVITRLLRKDPARRYRSASEVAEILGRCLAHVQQPLAAPLPDEVMTRASKRRSPSRRLRAWALAAALGVIAAACAALAPSPWWTQLKHMTAVTARLRDDGSTSHPNLSRPPRQSPKATRSLGGSQTPPDELSEQLQAAWHRAGALQADLHFGHADPSSGDPVSWLAHALSERARAVEQDISLSGDDRTPQRP
jgi:serine/threonine-protein kinase